MSQDNQPHVQDQVRDEVETILRDTESATLTLGSNLNSIVACAEEFVAEIQGSMASLTGSRTEDDEESVHETLNRQCEAVDDFTHALKSEIERHAGVADEVLETTKTVAEAARAVSGVASQARMLCFNTKIEAGRLGDQGRPFMVIANQMRALSEAIADSNDRISLLADALSPLLTSLKSNVASLQGRTDTFAEEYADHRVRIGSVTRRLQDTASESLTTADAKLAKILEQSNDSLVSLQSQDIIAQRLRRILMLAAPPDGDVEGSITAGVHSGLFTSAYISEDLAGSEPAEGSLESGEMELF